MAFDLSSLWDFNRPDLSEERFRSAQETASPIDALILQTQIARAYGLRHDFDHARTVLAEIETQVAQIGGEPAVRYWLELGRTYSSAAHAPETQTDAVRAQARHAYGQALSLAQAAALDALAVDALHMLAIVEETPAQQIHWNLEALRLAEQSSHPAARKWTASLHNNLGYTLHQLGRYDEALEHFELALAAHQQDGAADNIRIAHWMIAWTYRSMGRLSDALAIQLRLAAEWKAVGQSDPYVFEELAALYHALGNAAQAEHYTRLLVQARP
jgi:tetratricopeptide (TPR) repeat protein